MLCYRCGSHVQDGAEKCWNCGTPLTSSSKSGGASLTDLRERQRTRNRLAGVVYKIGDLIANRYKVKDITGSGGAGVVYRAHDQEIEVDVAVKVINAKLLQTAEERRLFAKESKLARKLSHQNIVRIYDEGRDGDRSFYTMQFLEGLPLRKIIDLRKGKDQRFTLPEIEPIYNQLCQALDYAHRTTYHGSLKPDNIIVLPDLLKVTDFGLLRGLPRKPFLAIQKSRGTNFNYYAPEVRLEVAELSKGVDVYSLGVVLWEMLTGTVYDDGKPEQLSIATSGVEPSLVKIVRRAVSRQPKDRYETTGELYEEIRAVLAKGDLGPAASILPPPGSEDAAGADNANEAPTQKLDITKHGDRPVDEAEGGVEVRRDEQSEKASRTLPPPPPAPNEDSAVEAAKDPLLAEGTGSYEAIDDDMIESAAAPAADGSKRIEVPPLAEAEDDEDDDRFADDDFEDDDEPTQAWNEMPDVSVPPPSIEDAAAAVVSASGVDEFEEIQEISESEIQLISDPRATNVIDIGADKLAQVRKDAEAAASAAVYDDGLNEEFDEAAAVVESKGDVSPSPSESADRPLDGGVIVDMPSASSSAAAPSEVAEVPLPDSVIPEPAFARFAEETRAGDLVESAPPMAAKEASTERPTMPPVVRGSPAAEGLATADGPEEERTVTKKPGAALGASSRQSKRPAVGRAKSNGATKRRAKARPMTRPRMAAMRPESLTPGVLFTPLPNQPEGTPTGARPLVVDGGNISVSAASKPPEREKDRTPLILFLLFVVFISAMGFMYKLHSDQQAKQLAAITAELARMKNVEAAASKGVDQATVEADAAAKKEAEAAAAAALAAKAAEDEAAKKLAAEEAERKAQEDEAAAKSAEEAAAAKAEAVARRREANVAADAEKAARRLAEEERKREAREARARTRAERKKERERRAAERAAAKAARLDEEREALQAARDADEDAAAARRERAAEARRSKEEAAARDDEARAAEQARQAALAEEERRRADREKASEAKKAADEEAEAAAAKEAKAAAAVKKGTNCPKGMKLIEAGAFMMGAPRNDPERNFGDLRYQSTEVGGYCIDFYEYPNGRGRTPATSVSQASADRMCKSKGKRLCGEEEWEKACKGPSGLRYPYGNEWDPARCATEDDEGNDRTVGKSGTFTKCRSGYNMVDMAGNVAEWTSSKWGTGYVIKGGGADRPGYDSRCAARKKKKKGYTSETVGYRCCADPE